MYQIPPEKIKIIEKCLLKIFKPFSTQFSVSFFSFISLIWIWWSLDSIVERKEIFLLMIRKAQWVIYCTIKIWIITRSVIKTLLELLWKESSGKKCYQNYFVRKTIDKLLLCFANYNFQCSFFLANLNEIAMSIASKYLFFSYNLRD